MIYIFLQEGYDPKPDPNSICTKQLVDELSKRGERTYIFCDGPEGLEPSFCRDKNIYHVSCSSQTLFVKASYREKIGIILKRIKNITIWPIRFPEKVNLYVERFEQVFNELKWSEQEITVISVYRPAEMVEVGYQIKKNHPQIKFVIYNLDGLNTNVNFYPRKYFEEVEQRWQESRYDFADTIFQMMAHKKYFMSSRFAKYSNKTQFVDYPLLVKNPHVFSEIENNSKYLYSGSFYTGLREPFYMIEWYKKISSNSDKLEIYTRNDFVDYIEDEAKKSDGKIERHDYVSSETMNQIIGSSKYLISVGNSNSPMVPSKLFVYMASCKCIVHFYSDSNDSCLPYLSKYPRALLIDTTKSVDENVIYTKEWMNNELSKKNNYEILFEDISKTFCECLPKYTVDRFHSC